MSASEEAKKIVKLIMTDSVVLATALIVTCFTLMSLPGKTESYQMGVVSGIVAVVGLLFAFVTCLSEDKIYSPGLAVFTGALFAFIYAAHHSISGKGSVFNASSIVYVVFILFFITIFSVILMDKKEKIINVISFFATVLINFGILYYLPKLFH